MFTFLPPGYLSTEGIYDKHSTSDLPPRPYQIKTIRVAAIVKWDLYDLRMVINRTDKMSCR